MLTIKETKEGVAFAVRVLPRSSRCEVAGLQGDAVKIRITDPPVEGRANEACTRFLASLFAVNRSRIAIKSGHKSKNKHVSIAGLTSGEVRHVLEENLRKRLLGKGFMKDHDGTG